jgi:hypothetical protein
MNDTSESLPIQNTSEYVEQQKESYDLPINKSGIELAASISNIISSAKLIAHMNLYHYPEVFNDEDFEQQREYLRKQNLDGQQIFFEQYSVKLSEEYRNSLDLTINSFLSDFKAYYSTNSLCELDKNLEYKFFHEFCLDLLKPEVNIQSAYELYVNLKEFLTSMGVEKEILEKIAYLIEKSSRVRYTTH